MKNYSSCISFALAISTFALLPTALFGVDVNGDGIEDTIVTVYPEWIPWDPPDGDYLVSLYNTDSSREYMIQSSSNQVNWLDETFWMPGNGGLLLCIWSSPLISYHRCVVKGVGVDSISGLPGVVCVNQEYNVTANLAGGASLGSGNTLNWGGNATIVSQSGEDATVKFTSSGTNKKLPAKVDNQSPAKEDTTKSVDLLRVEIVSGATAIADGQSTPTGTDVAAVIKGSGNVRLKAVLSPSVTESELPANFITWTGGTAVSGKQLERDASKSSWAKHTVTASMCSDSAAMLVYIIGASSSSFSPTNGTSGSHFQDNSLGYSSTGLQSVNSSTGSTSSQCEIEFSVEPAILITDGNNNLFDKNEILWDVSRDKKVLKWTKTSGTWTLVDDRGSTWLSDDSHDSEEDNNPWNGNGHLYGNDVPLNTPSSNNEAYVKKLNMREWVRVGLGGTSGRNGANCSSYYAWRGFRSLAKNGSWANSTSYDGNEIILGNQFWGSTPLSYP